jgi:hypothetical protein
MGPHGVGASISMGYGVACRMSHGVGVGMARRRALRAWAACRMGPHGGRGMGEMGMDLQPTGPLLPLLAPGPLESGIIFGIIARRTANHHWLDVEHRDKKRPAPDQTTACSPIPAARWQRIWI